MENKDGYIIKLGIPKKLVEVKTIDNLRHFILEMFQSYKI